jgi:histidyl-tRNA synthetase
VNNRGIQFAVLAGEDEVELNMYTLKDLMSGEQVSVDFNGLLETLK